MLTCLKKNEKLHSAAHDPLINNARANHQATPAKRFWNWYAKVYGSVENLTPHKNMLKSVAGLVPAAAQSILDAGCGSGALLQMLTGKYPDASLCGIDFSNEMLAKAKKRIPGLRACQGDLNKPLPYSDAQFDCVVCTNALYAVESPQRLVSEFLRVTKTTGTIVVSSPKCKARGTIILRSHLKDVSVFQGIMDMARFATCVIPNVLIERHARDRRYHFLTRDEVENIGGLVFIQADTFAEQNWLFSIRKERPSNEKTVLAGRQHGFVHH